MDPVVHFEIPADDKARIQKFYQAAFGWKTNQLGPEMGNYILATTTETDDKQMVKTPGTINGGIYERSKPGQAPRITISVKDIRESMKKVAAAGGTAIGGMMKPGEPDEIPGVGLYATFIDTEGNTMSMMQSF